MQPAEDFSSAFSKSASNAIPHCSRRKPERAAQSEPNALVETPLSTIYPRIQHQDGSFPSIQNLRTERRLIDLLSLLASQPGNVRVDHVPQQGSAISESALAMDHF
eukprot:6467201-Amphidinium_carterae.1